MKDRPILFSGEMVRAILAGTKTQTRRVMRPQPPAWVEQMGYSFFTRKGFISGRGGWKNELGQEEPAEKQFKIPYGEPGDRLWVREKFLPDPPIDGWNGDFEWSGCGRPISGVPVHYRAPEYCLFAASWNGFDLAWRPSIHMPRWASRILLEIVEVRAEHLRKISYGDALAEGVWRPGPDADSDQVDREYDAKIEYHRLWDEINAERGYAWESNPWVWVIEFRRLDPPNPVLT